ncbi:MAG TPA: chloride channel protein, partial [Candidatus Acidoferrales bacterium]|nr:chloride channel protein [Candidatus Acidoferrales bacterium]
MSARVEALVNEAPVAGFRIGYMSLLAALIGLMAGLVAFILYDLIGLFTNLTYYHTWSFHFRSPEGTHIGYWIILMPVIGGLIVGVMAKYGSEKIKGHGIPEAMEAVLTSRSRIEGKVAILKPISAAIAIGTGGPFGAEGPIIQTGGAMGSLVGQFISTTASERKVLLACGAGAGMAATFNTPIAGVILAIELLLFEFRARSFIPLVIATTIATFVRSVLLGQHSMFTMDSGVNFDALHGLPWYLLLGIICGFAAVGFTKLLYWVEDLFDHLPIDDLWHPAIGAFFLGVIGFFIPRVLGVGYDTISDILHNNLAIKILILLMIFKALALVISLGSGTSGGLLAPMFMSSAALGGVFAMIINYFLPGAHLSPGAYALVAMGAIFGAAARATFALIVFAFEITRNYNSVLPLMLTCVIADMIAIRYLKSSIMAEKLTRRGLSVPSDFEVGVLQVVRVKDVMRTDVPGISPDMTVGELADRMGRGDPAFNVTQGLPICKADGKVVGIVTQGDLLRALKSDTSGKMKVVEAGGGKPIVAYPDEPAFDALYRMLQNNIGRLPIVEPGGSNTLVGYLNRSSILNAWTRQIEEESLREHGWIHKFRHAGEQPKGAEIRIAVGRISELKGTKLTLDITTNDNIQRVGFNLAAPIPGVSVGDMVRVDYIEGPDGRANERIVQNIQEVRAR